MILLSFDIGVKNLAYCLLDTTDSCILDWDVLDCSGENETLRVIEELDKLEYLTQADIVLLEKQPSFNPKMRNISTAIYVYFVLRIQHEQERKAKILFYAAKHKLKCCTLTIEHKCKDKYRQNKNLGIAHTRHLLKSHNEFFESHKKKDDLADSYLQGLSYIIYFIKR